MTKKQSTLRFIIEIIVIVVLVSIVRVNFAAPFRISGASMDANYFHNEFIIVDRYTYNTFGGIKTWNIERGDVVVFRPGLNNGKTYYIKRVIGLPWDTVKIKDGYVSVKPTGSEEYIQLEEAYLAEHSHGKTWANGKNIFLVPEDNYFVLWDNRNNSSDSRNCFVGCHAYNKRYIGQEELLGKVWMSLGYLDVFNFDIPGVGLVYKPRFFNTEKDWEYNEL